MQDEAWKENGNIERKHKYFTTVEKKQPIR